MIDTVGTQIPAPLNLQPQETPLDKMLRTSFPMQNLLLATDPSIQDATSSQTRISLTPQALANIITNSVIKVMQSMMGLFMEQLQALMGMQKQMSPASSGSEPTPPAPAESTPDTTAAGGTTDSLGAPGTSTDSTDSKDTGSIGTTLTNLFGKITDFFFSDQKGIGGLFKDIVTSILPGGSGIKIGKLLSKFKSLSKPLQGLLKIGKDSLGTIFSKGKDLLSGLFKSGKSLFKKLF